MPRCVRNFFVRAAPTDGTRRAPIQTGPRTRDGGLDLTLYIRDQGSVRVAGTILGRRHGDRLVLQFVPERGPSIDLASTER